MGWIGKKSINARWDEMIAVNLTDTPAPTPLAAAEIVLEARPGDGTDPSVIPAHGGRSWMRSDCSSVSRTTQSVTHRSQRHATAQPPSPWSATATLGS